MDEKSPLTELTDRQRAFAEAYFALGGGHGAGKKAALAAGYAPESASQEASRALRNSKVLAAVAFLVDTALDNGTLAAARTLADASSGFVRRRTWDDTTQDVSRDSDGNIIETHQPVDPEMQIKSSLELLKLRGRFVERTQKVQVDHNHNHNIEAPKLMGRLGELLAKMGKRPEDILPLALPPPVDVPFVEVASPEDKRAAREERAKVFNGFQAAHRDMEAEEIKRAAREDARRLTEADLEKEEWE